MSTIIDRLESETFEAGRIVKVHGVNGRLVIRLNRPSAEVLDFPEWMFVRISGGLVPFSVAGDSVFQKDANHIVVGLEKIDGPEKAGKMVGLTCNLEGDWTDWFETAGDQPDSLTGYEVIDEISGKQGKVTGYQDIPGNPLLEIEIEGKEALLPLNTEFVVDKDDRTRKLVLRIPEGLLDL